MVDEIEDVLKMSQKEEKDFLSKLLKLEQAGFVMLSPAEIKRLYEKNFKETDEQKQTQ